jgi:short-chain fatty acids transporter
MRCASPNSPQTPQPPKHLSERVERHPAIAFVLCAVFAAWLWTHFVANGSGLNINAMNAILLLATFLLHRTVHNVSQALEKAVVSAWPVIFLYHLYAGLAGLIEHTPVGEAMASLMTASSNALTFPALSVFAGSVFSFFIPSSGGQWAIQGLVTAKAATALGLTVERGLLAMSVGDHMGNLISPFWYVVVAAIARIDFRHFFGYGLLYAAVWFVIGSIVFTFAPC